MKERVMMGSGRIMSAAAAAALRRDADCHWLVTGGALEEMHMSLMPPVILAHACV